jgi:aminopeptidase
MDKLVDLMMNTDEVRILGVGTDLTMSIKGMPVSKDAGHQNLPDGEVYAIPIKDSVNGSISFNTQVLFRGTTFENIVLTFVDGEIVDAKANDTSKLREILNIDKGSNSMIAYAEFLRDHAISIRLHALYLHI